MAAAAELHGDPRSGVSPELVLVDASLSAEVRHLLVLPEDTLERLLGSQRGRSSEEVEPLPELGEFSKIEEEVADDQVLAETPQGDCAELWHYTTDSSVTLPAVPVGRSEGLVNDSVSVSDHPIEQTPRDELEQPVNTYPTLPSPPPEVAQEDATETVLRLITGLPSPYA
jgi:hypothetical protein